MELEEIKEDVAALKAKISDWGRKSDGTQKAVLGMVHSQLSGLSRALEYAGQILLPGGDAAAKTASVPPKNRYGEGGAVRMTEAEHQKLLTCYGKAAVDKYIEKLGSYIGSRGKRYKSHYDTIRNWMLGDKVPVVGQRAELDNRMMQKFMED